MSRRTGIISGITITVWLVTLAVFLFIGYGFIIGSVAASTVAWILWMGLYHGEVPEPVEQGQQNQGGPF